MSPGRNRAVSYAIGIGAAVLLLKLAIDSAVSKSLSGVFDTPPPPPEPEP